MKKILSVLLAAGMLYSCDIVDVLDHEPPHNMTPESAVKDEKSAELALVGVYGNLIGYYSYFVVGNPAFTTGILKKSEKIKPGGNNIYYTERNLPLLKYGGSYQPLWDHNIQVINSGNLLLSALEKMGDGAFSDGRKLSMEGELRFLRAFSNFELLRQFGQYDQLDSKFGMILRKKPATANDVMLARSSVQETYDFILEDLDFAIQQAPAFKEPTAASSTAAKALKIKVLFYMGKYTEALQLADQFIAAGERSLEPAYGDIFTNFNNKELIFVRGFAGSETDSQISGRGKAFDEGGWCADTSFLELVENDPRREVILKAASGPYVTTEMTIKKAADANGTMPIYFMRYSEIYMIKAECEARTGAGDALATLNRMRIGHGLPVITSSDDVLETVYKEWLLELAFENGHEWYATWRMGADKLLKMNRNVRKEYESDVTTDKPGYKESLKYKKIYPIPSGEITANKLAEQNPGYN